MIKLLKNNKIIELMNKIIIRGTVGLCNTKIGVKCYRLILFYKKKFLCPICKYTGPFLDIYPKTGVRKNAMCPVCGALERHRLQYLSMRKIGEKENFANMSFLHIAPESFLKNPLKNTFQKYFSADMKMPNVDFHMDLTNIPIKNNVFDIVFASSVLEYIKNDEKALIEILRILKKKGIAILPVPIVGKRTIEYYMPNSHVGLRGSIRAPGIDYYDKYAKYFNEVKIFTSEDFHAEHQLYVYENREKWPSNLNHGEKAKENKHINYVPVCFKS